MVAISFEIRMCCVVGIDWVENRVCCKCILRVFVVFPYDLSYCGFDFVCGDFITVLL